MWRAIVKATCTCMPVYIHTYTYANMHAAVCLYREREREGERETGSDHEGLVSPSICSQRHFGIATSTASTLLHYVI